LVCILLLVELQALDRSSEVNFGLEKLIGRNFVLTLEVQLVAGVHVHLLIDHLRDLLALESVQAGRGHRRRVRELVHEVVVVRGLPCRTPVGRLTGELLLLHHLLLIEV